VPGPDSLPRATCPGAAPAAFACGGLEWLVGAAEFCLADANVHVGTHLDGNLRSQAGGVFWGSDADVSTVAAVEAVQSRPMDRTHALHLEAPRRRVECMSRVSRACMQAGGRGCPRGWLRGSSYGYAGDLHCCCTLTGIVCTLRARESSVGARRRCTRGYPVFDASRRTGPRLSHADRTSAIVSHVSLSTHLHVIHKLSS
jgi:hypothetical protein